MCSQFKRVVIYVLFALLSSMPAFAAVIFQDNFDGTTVGCNSGSTEPTGWSQWMISGMNSATVNGVNHYSGEISSPGRGSSGKSLKMWRAGQYWEGYDGSLVLGMGGAYSNIYMRYYVKLPTSMDLSECIDANYQKLWRLNYGAGSELYLNINQSGGSLRNTGSLQMLDNAGWHTILSHADLIAIWDGNWHCWEWHVNTATNTVELWIDGNLKFSSSSMSLNGGNFTMLQHMSLGNHATGSCTWQSSWQAMEIDDFVLSTTYVGPNSSGSGVGDTTAPTITAFAMPSTSTSLTVPISTFTATDATGVTGYCVATSNNSSGCAWATSAPSSVVFSSSGSQTAYAWAKDAAGNISTVATANVSITAPINGACGTANGQSFTTLSSASPNLCSTGTVTAFTGLGPWSWGCNGSGGGTSTSSTACYASLTTTPSSSLLFSESFENNSFAARGWYDNTNHGTIVSGGQTGNCLQWAWSQGATAPTNGGSMRMQITPTDSLYISYYVKFQSGWRGSQQNYHPHMIYVLSDLDNNADAYSGLANNYLNTYIEFLSDIGSPYAIRPSIALQDERRVNTSYGTPPNNLTSTTENRSVAYCNTPVSTGAFGSCYVDNPYYSANTWKATTASISTNVWHHVEVYFKMNTISGGKGQSDGIMYEWIDGVQVINQRNVLYRTNQDANKKWAQFVFAPWIGDGAPIAETMWIDELTVATVSPSNSSTTAPTLTVKSVSPN